MTIIFDHCCRDMADNQFTAFILERADHQLEVSTEEALATAEIFVRNSYFFNAYKLYWYLQDKIAIYRFFVILLAKATSLENKHNHQYKLLIENIFFDNRDILDAFAEDIVSLYLESKLFWLAWNFAKAINNKELMKQTILVLYTVYKKNFRHPQEYILRNYLVKCAIDLADKNILRDVYYFLSSFRFNAKQYNRLYIINNLFRCARALDNAVMLSDVAEEYFKLIKKSEYRLSPNFEYMLSAVIWIWKKLKNTQRLEDMLRWANKWRVSDYYLYYRVAEVLGYRHIIQRAVVRLPLCRNVYWKHGEENEFIRIVKFLDEGGMYIALKKMAEAYVAKGSYMEAVYIYIKLNKLNYSEEILNLLEAWPFNNIPISSLVFIFADYYNLKILQKLKQLCIASGNTHYAEQLSNKLQEPLIASDYRSICQFKFNLGVIPNEYLMTRAGLDLDYDYYMSIAKTSKDIKIIREATKKAFKVKRLQVAR